MCRSIRLWAFSLVGYVLQSVAAEQHLFTISDDHDTLRMGNQTTLLLSHQMSKYLLDTTTWILTSLFLTLYYISKGARTVKEEIPENKKSIPVVAGGLPFIGHGLYLFTDVLAFVNDCYKKYGGIFCVKFFRTKLIIIADSNMAWTYLKEQENTLSLEHALRSLNFDWPFYDQDYGLTNAFTFFRKSLAVRYDDLIPKIDHEAREAASRLRKECEARANGRYKCVIENETYRFIARTSHSCFMSAELKDVVLAQMRKLFGLINTIVTSSYFIPQKWIRVLFGWRVRQLRASLISHFEAEVKPYRTDPDKIDSMLIRSAVNFEDEHKRKLTDQEIAELMVGFMFVSTENTSVGLANALTCMVMPENAEILQKLREECEERIHDTRQLLKGPVLHACVMEMARISAHLFSIQRKPMQECLSVGEFYIERDVNAVALSGQMVMVHGNAEDKFKDPMQFNPTRFLGTTKEPTHSPNIVTWGGGLHLCPGRLFALYEIKIALAHLVLNFDYHLDPHSLPSKFDYFSPIAFAKRDVSLTLSVRTNKVD